LDAAADAEIAPIDRSHLSGPEFQSLREHLPGEDVRGVHALRSATIGTLVRRVTRGRMPRTVGVVLDLRGPPRINRGHGRQTFEWSLGACASLVEELHRRGCGMRVIVIDTEAELLNIQSTAELADLLTLLSEASMSRHRILDQEQLDFLREVAHCYWIPAGGYVKAPELQTFADKPTLITRGTV